MRPAEDPYAGTAGVRARAPVSTGVILAGGRSTRMGRPKALLEVGGRRLIDRVAGVLRDLFPEVLVVARAPEPYRFLGLPIVPDAFPLRRSLVGIYSGVQAAAGTHAFVCACDMPFLNASLIRYLCGLAAERDPAWDAVVPVCRGRYEPLHAVYGKGGLEAMRRTLESNGSNRSFLAEVRGREVAETDIRRFDPDLRSFMNVNTPEDLDEACRIAGARAGEP